MVTVQVDPTSATCRDELGSAGLIWAQSGPRGPRLLRAVEARSGWRWGVLQGVDLGRGELPWLSGVSSVGPSSSFPFSMSTVVMALASNCVVAAAVLLLMHVQGGLGLWIMVEAI
jgi:hypothetical protein